MSMKPLTFYQQGAVAGMQQDQYSQAPGFVESKNLDIFSSSQSVRATAWSEPKLVDANIVDVDHRGRFELHKNGKVRDREQGAYITDITKFVGTPISDSGRKDSSDFITASFGIPQKIFVQYEGDEWCTIVVITDRLRYHYLNEGKFFDPKILKEVNCEVNQHGEVTKFKNSDRKFSIYVNIENPGMTKTTIGIRKYATGIGDVKITNIINYIPKFVYNKEDDSLELNSVDSIVITPEHNIDGKDSAQKEVSIEILAYQDNSINKNGCVMIEFEVPKTENEPSNEKGIFEGLIRIDIETKTTEYYNYLPKVTNRLIYYNEGIYIIQHNRNIGIYKFVSNWYWRRGIRVNWYQFLLDAEYELYDNIISKVIVDNDRIFLWCNKNEDSFLIVLSLFGDVLEKRKIGRIEILGVELMNNIFYLIAKERGIASLYALSGEQIKKIVGDGYLESSLLRGKRFQFVGITAYWRDKLLLATEDGRIFAYDGNGAYILERSDIKKITSIYPHERFLEVQYLDAEGKQRSTQFASDRYIGDYQSDFSITYPKNLGSHLLEKEAKELEISYMIPNKHCSLEVWLNVNDYHFRTYEPKGEVQLTNGSYRIDGTDGDYNLKFIEKRENKLTFVLEGELPHQTEKKPLKLIKIDGDGPEEIPAKSFDHFKHIGTIREEQFTHGKQRLIALTAEHNLPRARVLQVRVDGKTDGKSSPEIYSVQFVSEQVER